MAAIERVTLHPGDAPVSHHSEAEGLLPGLRISARITTSSFSDYPEWSMEELQYKNGLITDGTCS